MWTDPANKVHRRIVMDKEGRSFAFGMVQFINTTIRGFGVWSMIEEATERLGSPCTVKLPAEGNIETFAGLVLPPGSRRVGRRPFPDGDDASRVITVIVEDTDRLAFYKLYCVVTGASDQGEFNPFMQALCAIQPVGDVVVHVFRIDQDEFTSLEEQYMAGRPTADDDSRFAAHYAAEDASVAAVRARGG
jgi:hypothetical protein